MAGSYFLAKLYRQHRSVVIAVPKPVLIALELKAGEHVVLRWNQKTGKMEFEKFILAGAKHVGDTEHTDSQDTSRPAQAAVGG